MTGPYAMTKKPLRRFAYTIPAGWYMLVILFLFAPIATSVIYSFNLGIFGKQTAVFTAWSLDGYHAAWNDLSLRKAIETSLISSFWAALLSVLVGSALGYALVRHPDAVVRRLMTVLTYLLLIVPETVIGVSLLLFYAKTHIPLGLASLVAGLTPMAISITALLVRSRTLTLDRHLEEAAADLGSNQWQTLWFIVMPQLLPAIAAGALMAYAFSFDNLIVSTFLTTPSVNTLPAYLYGSLQYNPAPSVYSAATAVFVFTLALLSVAALCYRLLSVPTSGSNDIRRKLDLS
jgi:ABC-type spermidine/putrescine transport system permease subunit II